MSAPRTLLPYRHLNYKFHGIAPKAKNAKRSIARLEKMKMQQAATARKLRASQGGGKSKKGKKKKKKKRKGE